MSEENKDTQNETPVSVKPSELKALIAQNVKEALDNASGGQGTRILKRVTERKVGVRMVDDKVVIGFKNRGTDSRPQYVYAVPDPKDPKQEVLKVDLVLEGAKPTDKGFTVNYNEFLREGQRVDCRIVHTEEHEWEINQGTVRKRETEEYSMLELDFEVPVDIVGKARVYTVEVPAEYGGGKSRQVKVHENYVNM